MSAANDIALLQQLAAYLADVGARASNLQADAQGLSPAIPPPVAGTLDPYTQFLTDILTADQAVNQGAINPSNAAALTIPTIITDIQQMAGQVAQGATAQQQIAALQAKVQSDAQLIDNLNQQIAALKQQIVPAPGGGTPKPAAPQTMSTAAVMTGVATVLAIAGGVWYVTSQAKTKAKEARAAGTFRPKAAASAAEDDEEEERVPTARRLGRAS
jgi:hypothetical protein